MTDDSNPKVTTLHDHPTQLERAQQALQSGNASLAFELYQACLAREESNQLVRYGAALSAARLGSISVAESLLQPLLDEQLDSHRLHIDCLSLMGRLEKDRYARELDESNKVAAAGRSAKAYEAAYLDSSDYYPGTNAATMYLLAEDPERAKALVRSVLPTCNALLDDGKTTDPWLAATLGELHLLNQELDQAANWYREAASLMGDAVGNIATMRRQLRLLSDKLDDVDALLDVLSIPTVATITGHMIDHPESGSSRFPTEMESIVSDSIHQFLEQHHVGIGYCSVACGVDILFAEALLDRGGEVHVYLPFDLDDFIATSVAFAGDRWVARLQAILQKASSVRYATHENYLGDDLLFSYNADVITGRMLLRAERLEVEPQFLAIYDFDASAPTGGSKATADSWVEQGFEVSRIDLRQLRRDQGIIDSKQATTKPSTPPVKSANPRAIRAMVFADIVGFSKLGEADTPHFFVGLLTAIANLIGQHRGKNEFRNTWGDGLFLVFNDLPSAAAFALDLRDLVNDTDWTEHGLPSTTNIRIALHVGPVYPAQDPILQCRNFFGSHVNQTARMEPITSPGSVFVSDQAAALIRFQASERFVCDYLGPAALPKDAGTIGLHRLRHRSEIE